MSRLQSVSHRSRRSPFGCGYWVPCRMCSSAAGFQLYTRRVFAKEGCWLRVPLQLGLSRHRARARLRRMRASMLNGISWGSPFLCGPLANRDLLRGPASKTSTSNDGPDHRMKPCGSRNLKAMYFFLCPTRSSPLCGEPAHSCFFSSTAKLP